MARRSNTIGKRFAKMRGLPVEEKMVMQRIARLMDAALNNRQPGNPYEPMHNKNHRVVYPVTGLTTQTGVKTIKLLWDAPPSDKHLRYSITFTNMDTGETFVRSSFTNNYTFHGLPGNYKAVVASIGRNNSTSPVKEITFGMQGDTIFVEGAKLFPNEIGTLVQEDIVMLEGYKIFIWASLVLDAYQGVIDNRPIILKLYSKEGNNATFDNNDPQYPLQLVEQIELYPATESASCLDDFALGQEIHRPVFPRVGSFETAQSVMFSPITPNSTEIDKRFTFFVQATNRELNGDEVGLSMVIWAGSEGQADSIPGDPQEYPPAYTFPHYNSFYQRVVDWSGTVANPVIEDARWISGELNDNYNLIGNQWTLGIWFKPLFLNYKVMAEGEDPGGDGVTNRAENVQTLFHRRIYHPNQTNRAYNEVEITIEAKRRDLSTGAPFNPAWRPLTTWYHQLQVSISSDQESELVTSPNVPNKITSTFASLNLDADSVPYVPGVSGYGQSSMFRWKIDDDSQNNGWYFIVVCFEGSLVTDANSVPKVRVYMNVAFRTHDDDIDQSPYPTEPQDIGSAFFHTLGMKSLTRLVANEGTTYTTIHPIPAQQALTSTREMLQNDRHHTVYSFGFNQSTQFIDGYYYGDEGKPPVSVEQPHVTCPAQIHQVGLWNVALDNWNGFSYAGQGAGMEALYYLYNGGRGTEINWRENSGPATDLSHANSFLLKGEPYAQSVNLVHLWQVGQIEQPFSTTYPGRDTGYHLFHGDINLTRTILPQSTAGTGTPNSYSNTTSIADVYSPEGLNGTTQSDTAYPGQQMPDSSI